MRKEQKRYKQNGYYYPAYYLVECPDCGKDAEIKPGGYEKYKVKQESFIQCNHCTYRKEYSDFIQYKAMVTMHCPGYGQSIHHTQKQLKNKPNMVKMNCPACEITLEVKPKTEKYSIINQKQNGIKYDPIFGFALWFQSEIKGNLFWAYNREHLTEIYLYTDAKLRERHSNYGMTMAERLPQFIKNAKNRKEVIQVIEKLLQK